MNKISEIIKQQAVALREQNFTYSEISKRLDISVDWCKRNLKEVDQRKFGEASCSKQEWIILQNNLPRSGEFVVYTFMDKEGLHLYTGSSCVFYNRLYQHRLSSSFYARANNVLIETFETGSEMLFNEAQRIAINKPEFNKVGLNGGVSRLTIAPISSITYFLHSKDTDYDNKSRSP